MIEIKDQNFAGERPLFGSHDLRIENVTIESGESALKEGSNITALNCVFSGKYPFWHIDGFHIKNCKFTPGARAALWYSKGLVMEDTVVDAPKMFRRMYDIKLRNVTFSDAQETFWDTASVSLEDVKVEHGDYLFMNSHDLTIKNLHLNGNYSFQNCRNVTIENSELNTKDAFWESENVTVINSTINGEYLGWHSKNLRLVNCRISGTQPLCYAENLIMENCTMATDADLAFEYSSVNATINSEITSVKNPLSGSIKAKGYGLIIIDNFKKEPADCDISILKS
ncbi:MAG: DUF3737 family protein [Succinivibrio sp.]|nr:DUF3737 family protein [Succinivibrio sp.]